MDKFYAGIGSRETPEPICRFMAQVADRLARRGYTLRSGGADGADSAFERGVPEGFSKEIYLPWRGFNGNASPLFDLGEHEGTVRGIAAAYHPAWKRLSSAEKTLHARNVCQVLGADGRTPSEFVLCFTPDGRGKGGTGQSIRIAQAHRIPVYDLGAFSQEYVLRKLGI